MFITNELNAGEMLAELLKGGRVSPAATAAFSNLRHDRDLCPRFANQVNAMLAVYKAYGREVHDIQSYRDDGVDVLMRYEDKDGQERRAGIQIKSEDEFRKWEKGKLPLIQILKGQFAQATANIVLDEFYVVLCVDAIRHQKRIRNLCSELKNFRPCEVIEPVDVLDFYQMPSEHLWARTARTLCGNDLVLRAATAESEAKDPDSSFFTITLLCRALDGALNVDDSLLYDIWSEWKEFAANSAGDDDRLADILWSLDGEIMDRDGSGDYAIQVNRLPKALCALYFDLKVRAANPFADLRDNILQLVEFRRRLELGVSADPNLDDEGE